MGGISRAITAALLLMGTGAASAQTWPARPVKLVVPFSPGAGTDALSRIVAQKMSEGLGQQIVVDNRPGAGGTLGTEIVAKSAPDGYTLLFAPAAHAINQSIYPKLNYDTQKDFVPISIVASLPVVLAVHASVPAKSVAELVALTKARPGQFNMGSAGNGTVFHLTGELLKQSAGLSIVHVPFKGGAPAMAALVAGQVEMAFETSLTVQPHAQSGALRPLAVASPSRIALFPDLPTLAEAGIPGILAENWYGLYAPAGTPAPIVMRVHQEVMTALKDPGVREKLTAQGAELRGTTPEEAATFVAAEMTKWAKVVKEAGVTLD